MTVAPSLTGFPVSHGMVPPPPLILRGSGGVLGSISVPQQQTLSSVLPLAYANYAMGSPQVGFFFRVEPPTILYLIYVWCLFWPLEPGCKDYAFLDQAVADFKQGLDSILTDSLETPDLDTSLQESNAVTSSVS